MRKTKEQVIAERQEALSRARNGRTGRNDMLVMLEFGARGIAAAPRQDVLSFKAWRALGRHVRKGEHGVRVMTYVPVKRKDATDDNETEVRPVSAYVFHISQTDPDTDPGEGGK